MRRGFWILLMLLGLVGTAMGAETRVDISKLSDAAKLEVLKAQQDTMSLADEAREWANLGAEVGGAFREFARGFVVEDLNAFASTPLGQWGMFIVTWMVFKGAIVGTVLWFLGTALVLYYRREFFGTYLNKVSGKREPRYDWQSGEARTALAAVLILGQVILTLACAAMILT